MDNTTLAFAKLANDIFKLFYEVLESDVGINKKVGINTLKDSRMAKTATIETDIPYFKIIVNEYVDYIEAGRKPKARKVPIDALRDWARRKGIPSDNSTLYAIQQAIYRDGIAPRPVMKIFYDLLEREWQEKMADELFEMITENLTKQWQK